MDLYRAKIAAKSSFSSKLQSDTFFGAFCWSFKYLYGETEFAEFLNGFRRDEPAIIFSNAFREGCLPLPMGVRDLSRNMEQVSDKQLRKKAYQENKRLKKCKFITLPGFQKIKEGCRQGYSDMLRKEDILVEDIMHNMVSRNSGTVKDDENGGNLFSITENHALYGYDLYVLTSMPKEKMEPVLELMLELGIGAKKSVGKGYFTLKGLESCGELLEQKECANAFVALSNFIPKQEDPSEGFYKTFVKYGKMDREYAATEEPFKKPLLFIESGAVFKTDNIKEFYGKCMQDIAVNPQVIVSAYTIALPICMTEEVLS